MKRRMRDAQSCATAASDCRNDATPCPALVALCFRADAASRTRPRKGIIYDMTCGRIDNSS